MYNTFFGFKEKPFQLVPNPAYLFLSKSHEEALAHLSYAVSQGDGFVEITGEVGTGKTTLCRAFLENSDINTETAYIFNPPPDAAQLLKTINEEFGIPAASDNRKELIDTLNTFLMKKKAEGKRIILLVDESQNLSKDVLEQMRMLSNLETTTSKLLQIILVGQPELRDLLDSRELRQLSQRITLSCHLTPLNIRETREYIHHRIRIASQKPGINFTNSAISAIYTYSSGIPRLINIACDRALLVAFGLNQHKITGSIAKAAIRELSGRADRHFGLRKSNAPIFILCLSLIVLGTAIFQSIKWFIPAPQTDMPKITLSEKKSTATIKQSENIPVPLQKTEQTVEVVQDFGELLKKTDIADSKTLAIQAITELWEGKPVTAEYLKDIQDNEIFFRTAATRNGLSVYRFDGNSERLRSLNLPAILEVYPPMSPSPVYLALIRIENQDMILKSNQLIRIKQSQLEGIWNGVAYIVWKNFLGITGTIPRDAPPESVITLKMMLRDMGHAIDIQPGYGPITRNIVGEIQKKYGLKPDGSVGPMTKIALYNEMKTIKIPHILPIESSRKESE
jgi:general secretion pathway protein A